ncbi:hypothetical protein [Candidatus Paracaedibacter symbiosus]|uniref:hypothetical protein n=1 Tax=Candidatus Paracaedibacter symbiosus TaxID=244582 RepID=UPI000509E1BA|nr:hypothetical protein [Candidatus Paracaedibacter symbiosus]
MIKFLLMSLGATSLSCALDYNPHFSETYYSSFREPTHYSQSYSKRVNAIDLMNVKIKILDELRMAAYRNKDVSSNRTEGLSLDQQSLQLVQEKYRQYSNLQSFFADLKSKLNQAAMADQFVSEWEVYQSMSETARQQYLSGVRINEPNQSVATLRGKQGRGQAMASPNAVVKFNLDDLKMYLLPQIEKNHQRCGGRDNCLQSDINLVKDMMQTIQQGNPDRNTFSQLAEQMKEESSKQLFDSIKFYADYYAYLVQSHPLLYKSKERQEWNDLTKTVRVTEHREAQILNRVEVKEESKPEAQMKRQLQQSGENIVNDLFGQIRGGSSHQGQGIFGSLFGK